MTMQAIVFDHAGEPAEVLRHADVAMPAPGGDQVLIKLSHGLFIRQTWRLSGGNIVSALNFRRRLVLRAPGSLSKALQMCIFPPGHGLPSGIPEAGRNMLPFR